MGRQRFTTEQIIAKLREADVLQDGEKATEPGVKRIHDEFADAIGDRS